MNATERLTAITSDGFFTQYTSIVSTSKSIRTRVREAIKYGLQTITMESGYHRTIKDVFDPPVNYEKMKRFPVINLLWGQEERTNAHLAGNNSLCDIRLTSQIDIFLGNPKNISEEQDNVLQDIQRYFGNKYYVPDSDGNRTAFDIIYSGASPWGMGEDEANGIGGVSVFFDVYYRYNLQNPEIDY